MSHEFEDFERETDLFLEEIFGRPIEELRKAAQNMEVRKMMNFDVVRKMDNSVKLLKHVLDRGGYPAKVFYGEVNPALMVGVVSAIAPILSVQDTGLFAKVAEHCDTVEIYPLANGDVRLDFGFYDMFVKI